MGKINVMIRVDKEKVEILKELARKISYEKKSNITYNELIADSIDKEYFNK